MPFINKNIDIKERRVKLFLETLHKAFTQLMLLDKQAAELIDEVTESDYIANLSYVDDETIPVLPLGTEKVLNFNSLDLDFESESKFIVRTSSEQELLNILELDYASEGEELPEGTVKLSNGLKIRDGYIIFKNLEIYEYDYKSYEILNEIYRAVEIFFESVESFYSRFYYDEVEEGRFILVYDTQDIDDEFDNVITPLADQITDVNKRTLVKERYELLRDTIKFFCMDIALKIDEQITNLLYCINGSKKYSVIQNIETKELEMIIDENGRTRRIHQAEEVFFPFHNKPTLNQFIEGIHSKF